MFVLVWCSKGPWHCYTLRRRAWTYSVGKMLHMSKSLALGSRSTSPSGQGPSFRTSNVFLILVKCIALFKQKHFPLLPEPLTSVFHPCSQTDRKWKCALKLGVRVMRMSLSNLSTFRTLILRIRPAEFVLQFHTLEICMKINDCNQHHQRGSWKRMKLYAINEILEINNATYQNY